MTKRIESDKALRDKAFKMGCNPKYDGYERQLPSLVYYFFDEKSKSSGIKSMWNQQLANKLHKPIIRKLKRRKVHSSFKENIWRVDLADVQLISKYNKGIRFLLGLIDIFSKYACVVTLKHKTRFTNIWKLCQKKMFILMC